MTMTPLETVKAYYDSLAPGRRQLLQELLDPNVVVELPEGMPGARRSYMGMKAYLEEFLFDIYGMFEVQFVPEEFFEAGNRVVALGLQKGRAIRTGTHYDVAFAHVWHVRHGRVTHVRMLTDTATLSHAAEGHPAPARHGGGA